MPLSWSGHIIGTFNWICPVQDYWERLLGELCEGNYSMQPKYAQCFAVFCFVVVTSSVPVDSRDV